jgi:hypothetical protein
LENSHNKRYSPILIWPYIWSSWMSFQNVVKMQINSQNGFYKYAFGKQLWPFPL